MAVRMQQEGGGIYFVTFTCYRWKPLLELTGCFDSVYKWFDYLREKGAAIIGFVIMPNHLHVMLYLPSSFKSLNTVISNAKRFIAYEIINRLENEKQEAVLQELSGAVKQRERKKGQRHKVFEESFDAKECINHKFIMQKLEYMHHNPVKGKWNLCNDFALYPHSSAGFYFGTGACVYKQIVRAEEIREDEGVNPGVSLFTKPAQ